MPQLFNYSYRVAPLNLLAGLTDFEIAIDARKIIYTSPNDGPELSVRLQSKSNDQIKLRPQGIIIAPFNRLYISGPVSVLTPQLIIASPADVSIESRDVNVSNISTLSTITNPVISKSFELDRAVAGQIFERAAFLGANVSNTTLFQIMNPSGSGKTVIVLGLRYQDGSSPAMTNRVRIAQSNTPLATLVGTLYNVNSGGAASVAQIRSEQPAAYPAANALEEWAPAVAQDNTDILRPRFDVLDQGEGLLIGYITTNVNAIVSARIYEF